MWFSQLIFVNYIKETFIGASQIVQNGNG